MKAFCEKLSAILKTIFGWGIMISLFLGGLTFFAYLVAILIGGDIANAICTFVYQSFIPFLIKGTTLVVLLGLVAMYFNGEIALTPKK